MADATTEATASAAAGGATTGTSPHPIHTDVTIRELAETIKGVVGFEGQLDWDRSKPDGTPRKLLDVSRMAALGWRARIGLDEGIRSTYQWFKESVDSRV